MEVIEHVADPAPVPARHRPADRAGRADDRRHPQPHAQGLALAKLGAEYILRWVPVGTHDWRKFLTPDELRGFLAGEPYEVAGPFGVAFDPLERPLAPSADADVNYMMTVAPI